MLYFTWTLQLHYIGNLRYIYTLEYYFPLKTCLLFFFLICKDKLFLNIEKTFLIYISS